MTWESQALDFSTEKVRSIEDWQHEPKSWAPLPFKSKMSSSEVHLLFRLARQLGDGCYADVGVYRGASTVCLAQGLYSGGHRGVVHAVDLFAPIGGEHDCDNEHTPELLRQHFAERFTPHVELRVHKGDSGTIGRALTDPLKLVFIDADHSYEGCKRDMLAWSPRIEIGGMLVFHDTHLDGVHRVVQELDPHVWSFVTKVYSTKVFRRATK